MKSELLHKLKRQAMICSNGIAAVAPGKEHLQVKSGTQGLIFAIASKRLLYLFHPLERQPGIQPDVCDLFYLLQDL